MRTEKERWRLVKRTPARASWLLCTPTRCEWELDEGSGQWAAQRQACASVWEEGLTELLRLEGKWTDRWTAMCRAEMSSEGNLGARGV